LIEIKTGEADFWCFGALTIWPPRCNTASHRAITLLNLIVGQKFARSGVIDHRALIQRIGTIGDIERQFHILLDQQNRRALCLIGAKQREYFVYQDRLDTFRAGIHATPPR
jgi:hypothetical protein